MLVNFALNNKPEYLSYEEKYKLFNIVSDLMREDGA